MITLRGVPPQLTHQGVPHRRLGWKSRQKAWKCVRTRPERQVFTRQISISLDQDCHKLHCWQRACKADPKLRLIQSAGLGNNSIESRHVILWARISPAECNGLVENFKNYTALSETEWYIQRGKKWYLLFAFIHLAERIYGAPVGNKGGCSVVKRTKGGFMENHPLLVGSVIAIPATL